MGMVILSDLSKFVEIPFSPTPTQSNEPINDGSYSEQVILIKKECTFEEVISIALKNRATHPDEPIEWCKDSKGTYTLNRVVKTIGT